MKLQQLNLAIWVGSCVAVSCAVTSVTIGCAPQTTRKTTQVQTIEEVKIHVGPPEAKADNAADEN